MSVVRLGVGGGKSRTCRRAAIAGVLLAGLAAACTDEEPPPEPPPTEEPRPETRPPEPPDALQRDDEHGAEAAARYFVELYPYVYATGDLDQWERMSGPDCRFCQSVLTEVTELVSSGDTIEGGLIEVTSTEVFPPTAEEPNFLVQLEANEEGIVHLSGSGDIVSETRGSPLLVNVILSNDESSGWIIEGVDPDATAD